MIDKQLGQQTEPQSHQPYYEDEKINLIDYLRVIWKWKWLIIAGVLICVIVAAIISLQMPKIFEVSMVIEPGIAGVNNFGDFVYIDSAENINEKINEEVYNRRVEKALQLDPLKTRIKFKATLTRQKTNVIKVTSRWRESDINLGIKSTWQMINLLSDDYERIVQHRRGACDEQIKLKLNKIENTQNEIKMEHATLENIKQRREELLKEIRGVKENTGKIVQQRDVLLKNKIPDKDLSLLLYSTTIQQNVTYFNQLKDQNYGLMVSEKEMENKIDKLNKTIDDIGAQINTLTLEKELVSNIKIIQEPEASIYPIKPNKKKIIFFTGVAVLFVFVFLAFCIEYIRNARQQE